MKKLSLLLMVVLLTGGCATVPVTGRKQLSLVSSQEINTMSASQYGEIITKGPLSTNAEQVAMVRRVGGRIQKAVEQYMATKGASDQLAGFNWEFNVIQDDKTVNAWCMPGGKVAFYTAILPICKDESGIAVVMGHEVAHAIANHGRERIVVALGLRQCGPQFAQLRGVSFARGDEFGMACRQGCRVHICLLQ
jgi:Zn-dependent protease with chaperone function